MRKRFATSIFAIVLLGVASPAPAPAQEATPEGRPILSIAFEPARQPLPQPELLALLPVHPGDLYRSADIRAAIERLYATGRYQDIQVDASPAENGLALRFITVNSWFIGGVSAVADLAEPPSNAQLVSAARLEPGAPFDPDLITAAVANIRKLLIDNGYFDPVIAPSYVYDQIYQQVQIAFSIRTGRRAHYTDPVITGDSSVLTNKQIVQASGWRRFLLPGYDGITERETRRGIDHIRLKYSNSNRLLATVVLNGIDEKDPRTGVPRLTVNPGARVEVGTIGAKLPKKDLRDAIPIFEEHAIDPDLIAEGTANLRSYFQARGYFDAETSLRSQEQKGDTVEINYLVARGLLHRVTFLGIAGNKYFDDHTLRERMFIAPKSFELSRGRYSEAYRRRDTESLLSLYQSNGFQDAKVTSHTVDNYKGRTGDIAVFFEIEEGPQYTVSSLTIKGPRSFDLSQTIASLGSQSGQPFSEFNVASDRQAIIEQYGDHGFPHATFEWNSKPGPRPHTFDLEFTIGEGDQQTVRDVLVSGLRTTRPGLVNRQLQLGPGSPLSPGAMAETERRLDDLGIFAQVDMAVQNPDGEESSKYVLYNLEEASRYSLTIGAGFEFARIGGNNALTDLSDPGGGTGFSPNLTVSTTRLNFLGRGQSLNFQGRLSSLQRRALLNYLIPKPFDSPKLNATFSLLYDDTHDIRTFESKRAQVSAQLSQRLSKPITVFYRFTYRRSSVDNLKIDPLLVPLLAQSVRVGVASFNLIQDRRDDPLDPHKGIYNTIDAGLATKAFGSQTSYLRILGRNATYYRLGQKLVLARETQMGIQPAFAIPKNSDLTDPIPLAERFFGGGGNTQRGVPENQAGPRDSITGFPLGGSALFFNNVELRFPLLGSSVNGVLFEDAGNVYSSLSQLSFRTEQRNINDFSYMVHAAGFGIRYKTPVGPLRMDLAYSINPPRFDGFPGNYSQLVQCSAAGTCQASPQQISHFQFFFSIGQAF